MISFSIFLLFGLFAWSFSSFLFTNKKQKQQIKTTPNKNTLSLIVAFKNEEDHLPVLLKALENQNIPPNIDIEYLFVDDSSTDKSVFILTEWKRNHKDFLIKILANSNKSGKKGAIKTAVLQAKGSHFLFTDADCKPQHNWLQSMWNFSVNHDFVIGKVWMIEKENNLFSALQKMEFSTLQVASQEMAYKNNAFLCNAANMLIEKNLYLNYLQNSKTENIASGDDVFLLQYARSSNYSIGYNSDTFVETNTLNSLNSFINQRVRWFSKTNKYTNKSMQITNLFFGLWALFFTLLAVFHFFNIALNYKILIISKVVLDLLLIQKYYNINKQKFSIRYYLVLVLVYPIYLIFIWLASLFYTPKWKN